MATVTATTIAIDIEFKGVLTVAVQVVAFYQQFVYDEYIVLSFIVLLIDIVLIYNVSD